MIIHYCVYEYICIKESKHYQHYTYITLPDKDFVTNYVLVFDLAFRKLGTYASELNM